MRYAVSLAGLLVMALGTPVAAQDTDEQWCRGLVDYFDTETRLNMGGEVGDLVLDGCVGYVVASGWPDGATAASDNLDSEAAQPTPIVGEVGVPLEMYHGDSEFAITVTYRGANTCEFSSICLPSERKHVVWVDFEATRGTFRYSGWDLRAHDQDGNIHELLLLADDPATGTLDPAAGRKATVRGTIVAPKKTTALWLDWTPGERTVASWPLSPLE